VVDFRYAQFCPLTRAVEILGERWTILIVRELFLGPKRFSDLRSALNGVSPSVLAERLARLEEKKILARRELPPPAASIVYELDDAGRALRPLLVELTRWGVRFLDTPDPADSFRPEWLLLGLQVFARTSASDALSAHLHIEGGAESVDIYVAGSRAGTVVSRSPVPCDVRVSAPPMDMLMFANGLLVPGEDGSPKSFRFDGDVNVVRRIPSLFDFSPTPAGAEQPAAAASARTTRREPRRQAQQKTAARSGIKPAAKRSRPKPGPQGAKRP
jgi:DNA-binding HxlR family transcriptional regulator